MARPRLCLLVMGLGLVAGACASAPSSRSAPPPTAAAAAAADPSTLPWRHPPPTRVQVRPPPPTTAARRAAPTTAQPTTTKATPAPTMPPPPPPTRAPAPPSTAPPSTAAYVAAPAGSFKACVMLRESTDGRGSSNLYGILDSTWRSLGRSGSPYTASPAEQSAAFDQLYAMDGKQPWAPYDGCS